MTLGTLRTLKKSPNVEGEFIKINKWLRPLSWLYGLGVALRNIFFEMGVLKSRSFSTPVIAVGNITIGGTGKTPHTEYLVRLLLARHYKVAVLSRGYKRKSRGFHIADKDSTADTIGDEPMQMKKKFPEATIAVDKDRCHGIDMLLAKNSTKDNGVDDNHPIDAIVLDDAFQHRYVKPSTNILLIDYHRLIIYDELLPAGRLREPVKGKNRADIVIVTKCPSDLRPMDFRVITKALNLFPYQKLYFTTLTYAPLHKIFGKGERTISSLAKGESILLLTGIASPTQILIDLEPYTQNITTLTFADHHRFKSKDIDLINNKFASMPSPKIMITTEKDATKLIQLDSLSREVKQSIYALPIEIKFMLDQEPQFARDIIGSLS